MNVPKDLRFLRYLLLKLFSYMKVLDVPVGLLVNFHQPVLRNGISRLILPGANQMEGSEDNEVSF